MFKTIAIVACCLCIMTGMWAQELKVEEVRTLKNLNDDERIMNSVTFSPDGKMIATACDSGLLTLWDAASGAEIRQIKVRGRQFCVRFTPDGKGIASVNTGEGKIYLYNGNDGKEYLSFKAAGEISLAFDKKGGRLLGARDGLVTVWDTKDGKQLLNLKAGTGSAFFSPDDKLIVAGKGHKLFFWNAETGKELPQWNMPKGVNHDIRQLALSPDGKFLAFSASRTICLWDIAKREIVKTFEGHKELVQDIVFSPNGEYLVSGSDDKTVRLIVVNTGKYFVCSGHTQWVVSVAFSPNGEMFASASRDKTVKVWKIVK